MSRIRRILLALGIVAICQSPVGASALQSATLEPQYPEASLCTVSPRSLEDLQAIAGEHVLPNSVGAAPGTGNPGTQEDLNAMSATVEEMVACSNAGDYLRFYSLFSDAFLKQGVIRPSLLTDVVQPVPPEERIAYIGIVYPREFADGRIGGVMIVDDPRAPAPAEAAFYFFVRSGNRWLIDGTLSEFAMDVTTSP